MKIKFANDEITEFAVGNFHYKNEKKSFDVLGDLAVELLNAKAALPSGEVVNVFEPAAPGGDKGRVTSDESQESPEEPAGEEAGESPAVQSSRRQGKNKKEK